MKAELIIRERLLLDENSLIDMRVWRVPKPVFPATHSFKYSFVYIVNGERVVGYDNERGKGDHRHLGNKESSYSFTSIEKCLSDFKADIERVRGEKI